MVVNTNDNLLYGTQEDCFNFKDINLRRQERNVVVQSSMQQSPASVTMATKHL